MTTEHPQATLANWREHPYSIWGFTHVDSLLPVAVIRTSAASPLPQGAAADAGAIAFDHRGVRRSVAQALAETHTDAFLILKDGALACEQYFNQTPDRRHIVFSVSKSITAMLAGVLVGQGRLEPAAPVTRYVPEAAGSAYGDCTVRHVLDMSVSVRFVEDYVDPRGDVARYRVAMGWNPPGDIAVPGGLHAFITSLPKGDGRHGERFHYVSPNTDMLGWIIERAAGSAFAELLSRHIWQPMQMEHDAFITLDGSGAPRTAGGICTAPGDLARFGDMVRLNGSYGGRRIVPESWIADILGNGDAAAWSKGDMTGLFPRGRYRSAWYVPEPDAQHLWAIGIHGQWLYIDRDARLVIVKLSSQPAPTDEATDMMTAAMFGAIANALA
jgi:CubicO group peptidase (beta-lactamase class C family)